MKINEIAKLCHEVNKAYCEAIGDTSQVRWDNAPDWQRESAINGVKFHLENKNTTPADSHNSWLFTLFSTMQFHWKKRQGKSRHSEPHIKMLVRLKSRLRKRRMILGGL